MRLLGKKVLIGHLPTLLLLFVSFSLGWSSAEQISILFGIDWIVWPLRIGFTGAEFMIISWYIEPEKDKYTNAQLSKVKSAKNAMICGGFIDGVLIAANIQTGQQHDILVIGQAFVTFGVIFYCAYASMFFVENDVERLSRVAEASNKLQYNLEKTKLELQQNIFKLEMKRMEVAGSDRARSDLKRFMLAGQGSKETQEHLKEMGRVVGEGMIMKVVSKIARSLPAYYQRMLISHSVAPEGLEIPKDEVAEKKLNGFPFQLTQNGNGSHHAN